MRQWGEAVRDLDGQRSAVILANHGPVVTAGSLQNAVYAMEELEEAARLTLTLTDRNARLLSEAHVASLVKAFETD